ncbi:glycosyltransferase family 9 protein [Sphingobacterium sp. SGR-19]|uniref:glycosyltransferase family 9 protein n=1 Tax=Sphingobacterium sp. SGR-19 TaxID=2710886 RepID=UPI0013ED4C90|nr:glycosyltransferase family 9 protein [Sphingobacterium sp. SGR-19]NGM64786.1 glycosyltransferase family 9 protein [Sphingobacterium sp. SGR-19]
MKKARVLVIRFSAMGDVAMVASVLQELSAQHKQIELVMVSRPQFAAFFESIPNLTFHPIFPDEQHKGPKGLWRLFNELKKYDIDYVADLHNNIRSRILTLFFKTAGYRFSILDKARHRKKELTRKRHKIFKPLRPTVERYADVFRALGFALKLKHQLQKEARPIPDAYRAILSSKTFKIGIASFAQHPYKVWKLRYWDIIFKTFPASEYTFFIFGGGKQESETATTWSEQYPHVCNTIGQLGVKGELDLISHLDFMISMDSSGMHMASLVGIRCLSIWGATHPYAGFLGYGQSMEDCIQVEHPNRPSSIYGNKSCICNGVEAIDLVTPEMVVERIQKEILSISKGIGQPGGQD